MDRHSPFDDRPELPPVPDVEADEGAMPVQSSGENAGSPPAKAAPRPRTAKASEAHPVAGPRTKAKAKPAANEAPAA